MLKWHWRSGCQGVPPAFEEAFNALVIIDFSGTISCEVIRNVAAGLVLMAFTAQPAEVVRIFRWPGDVVNL
jgi:hypothetical protein